MSESTARPAGPAAQTLANLRNVARLAFRESRRSRVLHALLIALILATGLSHVVAWVSGDDPDRRLKIVADLSLSAIVVLGTIATIFLGTNMIHQEVQRRTVYTVLARPVGRGSFIVGKFFGLLAVLGVAVGAMGAAFLVSYGLARAGAGGAAGAPLDKLLLAVVFVYVELAIVAAMAIFFSVAAHPIEGAVFAFVAAIAGHMTAGLRELGRQLVEGSPDPSAWRTALAGGLDVLYYLLPNLERLNIRSQAVHDLHLDPAGLALSVVYAALCAAIILAVAVVVFRRKVL